MDDISDIRKSYNLNWDREDDRLQRHQLERDITWRYLEKYLPRPGAKIIEIGAATGRYTVELARRGYNVLAIELASELVARAKERISQLGFNDRVNFQTADARMLPGVPENTFDVALLMGPLYHLVFQEDRLMAIKKVHECLKPGGIIFSAWVSRHGVIGNILKVRPNFIEDQKNVDSFLQQGIDTDDYRNSEQGSRFYRATISEIAPIHELAGFRTLIIAGVEPAISADDESYNRLTGETRKLWLDLLFKISGEPSMLASSRHLLYIGKKPIR